MKKFVFYIIKIIVVIVISAILLDATYTLVYLNTNSRNKIVNIYNSKNKNFDLIFLGSSRANNHFDAKVFNDSGIKTFNYGKSGASLNETALMLKLMVERNYKIKNIILEVDLNINTDGFSEGTRALFMPYLQVSNTTKNHYKLIPEFNKLYYIPFYRYINFDVKIGFREMFFSAIKKKSNDIDNFGFYPLNSEGKNMKYDLLKRFPKKSKSYEEIKKTCQDNNINLIVISTPMCKNTIGIDYFDKIKKVYPEIINYENVINEDKYFSSCGHLNSKGAKIFTTFILKDLFNKLR